MTSGGGQSRDGAALLWQQALADIGPLPEPVLLVELGDLPSGAMQAFYLKPGAYARTDPYTPLSGTQLVQLNGHGRTSHRVAVYDEPEPILLGAKLRHELEHAYQQMTNAAALEVGELLMHTLSEVYGGGGPASTAVYGAMPHERAANSRAAAFARRYFGDEAVARVQQQRQVGALLGSDDPEPRSGLGSRLLARAALDARTFEDCARFFGINVTALAQKAVPCVRDPWGVLQRDIALPAHVAVAAAARPDVGALEAAARPRLLWQPVLDLLMAAEAHGVQVLDRCVRPEGA